MSDETDAEAEEIFGATFGALVLDDFLVESKVLTEANRIEVAKCLVALSHAFCTTYPEVQEFKERFETNKFVMETDAETIAKRNATDKALH